MDETEKKEEHRKKCKEQQQSVFDRNWRFCYEVDNNFAYKKDVFDAEKTKENSERMMAYIKCFNFVPTYDCWCIYCGKRGVSKRCTRCKHVFFCNQACQTTAWPIHKRHCGRNVFSRCATCGTVVANKVSCPDGCPVAWCSESCREQLLVAHRDFDCVHFQEMFGKNE